MTLILSHLLDFSIKINWKPNVHYILFMTRYLRVNFLSAYNEKLTSLVSHVHDRHQIEMKYFLSHKKETFISFYKRK